MQNITDISTWVTANIPPSTLNPELHCATRDVFGVRLETLLARLEKQVGQDAYLLTAIVGEIGNNSFDHNLGNWPDITGIYFVHDKEEKTISIADRGQGIRKTISRIKLEVASDSEALMVAFTQVISGRAPERRGNGLKFVVRAVEEGGWPLSFQSGNAILTLAPGRKLATEESSVTIRGTLAILRY